MRLFKKKKKTFFIFSFFFSWPLCRSPCRHYSSINWPIKMFILFARFSHQIETWKENLEKNCLLKTYSGKEIQFRLFDKLVTYFSVNAFFSRFHYFSPFHVPWLFTRSFSSLFFTPNCAAQRHCQFHHRRLL